MSEVGICGNTVSAIGGGPLICDLPARHDGWHGCEQPYTSAPMATATLTSTVSRCHWTEDASGANEIDLTATERAGYERAVANLRSLVANFHPAGHDGVLLVDAVRYLEATKETDR